MLKAQTGEAGNGSVLLAPSDTGRRDGDGEEARFRSDLITTRRFLREYDCRQHSRQRGAA